MPDPNQPSYRDPSMVEHLIEAMAATTLDDRLLAVILTAVHVAHERDSRGVVPAGDIEDLADDVRRWRMAKCPVLREP